MSLLNLIYGAVIIGVVASASVKYKSSAAKKGPFVGSAIVSYDYNEELGDLTILKSNAAKTDVDVIEDIVFESEINKCFTIKADQKYSPFTNRNGGKKNAEVAIFYQTLDGEILGVDKNGELKSFGEHDSIETFRTNTGHCLSAKKPGFISKAIESTVSWLVE